MPADGWRTASSPVAIEDALTGHDATGVELARRLAKRLLERPMRWGTLRTFATRAQDTVRVESVALALHRAGWVAIRYRLDRRGDALPVELRVEAEQIEEIAAFVGVESPDEHARKVRALTDALAILRDLGVPPVPERVLVHRVLGATKAARLRVLRAELELALGVPLERLVRFHVDSVLTAGPVTYAYAGIPVDLRGSDPWAAVTERVVHGLTDLLVEGVDEIVCVENQTAFEALLYEGLARDAVVVFTSGFLGSTHRRWLAHLVGAGIRRVRHWGDLDPFGLSIYRDLRAFLRSLGDVAVAPWRMDAADLGRPDTAPLAPEDWVELHRYLKLADAPQRELAEAMHARGRKLEQEALLRWPG